MFRRKKHAEFFSEDPDELLTHARKLEKNEFFSQADGYYLKAVERGSNDPRALLRAALSLEKDIDQAKAAAAV